ncbi:MAG: sigma-70 family RNA polymerase sigma factor [bacterium]
MHTTSPNVGLKEYLAGFKDYPTFKNIDEGNACHARYAAAVDPKIKLLERDRLVYGHRFMVISVARRYQYFDLVIVDLVQAGFLGVLRAIDKYDPKFESSFFGYARRWAEQSIQRAVQNGVGQLGMRRPVHVQIFLRRLARAIQCLQSEGRSTDPVTILKYLRSLPPPEPKTLAQKDSGKPLKPPFRNLGLRKVKGGLIQLEAYAFSLDEAIPGSDNPARLRHEAVGSLLSNPEDALVAVETLKESTLAALRLREAFKKCLPPRDAAIISMRFGFNGEDPLTLEDLGKRFGLTREGIRQIEVVSFNRLRSQGVNISVEALELLVRTINNCREIVSAL